jgi:hypothetical protein
MVVFVPDKEHVDTKGIPVHIPRAFISTYAAVNDFDGMRSYYPYRVRSWVWKRVALARPPGLSMSMSPTSY